MELTKNDETNTPLGSDWTSRSTGRAVTISNAVSKMHKYARNPLGWTPKLHKPMVLERWEQSRMMVSSRSSPVGSKLCNELQPHGFINTRQLNL